MRGNSAATRSGRRIQVTADDMERLRDLVRGEHSRRDRGHLTELEEELDRAEVITSGDVSPDVVTMNSVVRVHDLDSGASTIYTLVFPRDADIARHRISVLAPIGVALIGYRAGDRVEWSTPGGRRRLRVDEVLFQPEAAAA